MKPRPSSVRGRTSVNCWAATPEERLELLRHYVEVIELHSDDPKGKTGTYAMRLFPEVRPDRGFDFVDCGTRSRPMTEIQWSPTKTESAPKWMTTPLC
ncbi:MAG: hypothetical protein U0936_26030 [Planctomycetaceae bacterium]